MDHKEFLATFAFLSLVAGCCVMLLLFPLIKGEKIFHPEPSAEEISNSFFSSLAQGNYQDAFNLCDEALQHDLADAAGLQSEMEKNLLQPAGWEVQSRSISSDEVELSGSMDFRIHMNGTFQMTLRHYEEGWKVSVFFLDY